MAKTLVTLLGGAVTLTEDSGVLSLNLDASLGGGQAAGLLKGQASLQLDVASAVQLGEALANKALPPSLEPAAEVVEEVLNPVLEKLE